MTLAWIVGVTVVTNALLWIEYGAMRATAKDFGRVPNGMRTYLLVAFFVAYAANLAAIALIATNPSTTDVERKELAICVGVFYLLQLKFLPLVRLSIDGGWSRWWVRALLLLCVLPVLAIGRLAKTTVTKVLCGIVVLHCAVNDAVLYGFLF